MTSLAEMRLLHLRFTGHTVNGASACRKFSF